jgi:trigger factor
MKVDIEKLEGDQVNLTVELTPDEFARYYEEELEKILAEVEIKGFRKGKAPRALYLRRFGEGKVLQQAFDHALNDSYFEALVKNDIRAIDDPKFDIDFEKFSADRTFRYTAQVPVYPEIKLGQYFGVEIEKMSTEVSEAEINDYVQNVRKNKSDLEIAEGGTLEKGNVAVFDFEGFINGEAFPGGKSENYQLEIGSGQFIPGFEEQMIGMKAEEEKTISVTFPEDYPAENLKGKPAEFKIKLHEIKKRVLPELNEEFVKELGIEGVETVEAYLAYVKEQLAKAKQEESERKFEYDLLKKICDDATMNVPQVLIDRRIDSYIEAEEKRAQGHNMKFEQLLAYQGMNLDQYREYVAGTAAFEVRKELVLNEIIKAENIALDEADYEKGYRDIADAYRMTPEEVKERFPQENVTHYFLLNKTVDLLKEKAIVQAQK